MFDYFNELMYLQHVPILKRLWCHKRVPELSPFFEILIYP